MKRRSFLGLLTLPLVARWFPRQPQGVEVLAFTWQSGNWRIEPFDVGTGEPGWVPYISEGSRYGTITLAGGRIIEVGDGHPPVTLVTRGGKLYCRLDAPSAVA